MATIKHNFNSPSSGRFRAVALEQRMLLDGAAVATALDISDDPPHAQTDTLASPVHGLLSALQGAATLSSDRSGEETPAYRQVVFVDNTIDGYQALVAGARQGADVFVVDGGQDGLSQILTALRGRGAYDSIRIFSHGRDGALRLGSTTLSSANLDDHSAELALLGGHLEDGGDLLLFGCNIAQTEAGRQFVDRLAALTGADVAASADLTGGVVLEGADWDLEYSAGTVEEATPGVSSEVLAGVHGPLDLGWVITGQFQNSYNANSDEIGWAVAADDQNGWVVAGGWDQTEVYAYKPTGIANYKEYRIEPPGAAGIDAATNGVSVDVDGNFMIIGYGRNTDGSSKTMGQTGWVFIYEYVAAQDDWVLRHSTSGEGGFGYSVAIQADGTNYRAAIGAPKHTEGSANSYGVVFLAYSSDQGANWHSQDTSGNGNYYIAPPKATTVDGRNDNDLKFGFDVAMDGNSLVVGAPGWGYRDSGSGTEYYNAGRAYVFDWTTGNNNYIGDKTFDQVLYPDGGPATQNPVAIYDNPNINFADAPQLQQAEFGAAVDIWDNGTSQYIVVGAPGEGGISHGYGGETYIFHGTTNGTSARWFQSGATQYNMVPGTNAPIGARYGYSVAVDGNSGLVAVGAYSFNIGGSNPESGRVLLYNLTGTQQGSPFDGSVYGSRFGFGVALAREMLVMGAPWYDTNAADTGAQNGLIEVRLLNAATVANNDSYYLWESVTQALNVRGNDSSGNTSFVDPLTVIELGDPPAKGEFTIVDGDVTWNPNGDFEYLRGYRNATYTVANDGRITVTSANHNYQAGDWILLQTGADTNPATPSASQHDQLQVVESVIDANTFVLAPDWENTRWSTYTRAAGSNTIRVDANYAHYLEVGDTVWFDYTSGGMTTDKSYTVTTIVDVDTFEVVDSSVISGSGTYVKGSGATTSITFTSNGHTRQIGDVVNIDFTGGSFVNRDAQYTITAVTANTFTVTENAIGVTWSKGDDSVWWNLNWTHQLPIGGTLHVDFTSSSSGYGPPTDGTYSVISGDANNNFNLQDNTTFLEGNGNGATVGGGWFDDDSANGSASVYISQAAAANFSWSMPATSGNVTWVATDPGSAQILDVALVQQPYTVVDMGGEISQANFNIFVYGQNDPVAAGSALSQQRANAGALNTIFSSVNPDSPMTLLELEAYTDADWREVHGFKFNNGSNTITVASNEAGGGSITFTINATTGAVTFTPTLAQQGFTYTIPGIRVNDLSSYTDIPGCTVQVERPNSAPIATGGTLSVTSWEDNFRPGTYSQSGNTVTVTAPSAHSLSVGDVVALDYLSGLGVDASYVVSSVDTVNKLWFTVTETSSQTASGNTLFSVSPYVSTSTEFSDADFPTEELTYSLIGAPSWITISPMTGRISLAGSNSDVPSSPASFTVRATDMYQRYADKAVTITLNPVNDPPAVTNEVPFTSAYIGYNTAGDGFAYDGTSDAKSIVKLPSDLFTDLDLPTANTYTLKAYVGTTEVTTSAGPASWSWLRFNATTGRFYASGVVNGNIYDVITVRVEATDTGSPSMKTDYYFDINLFAQPQNAGYLGGAAANNSYGYSVAVSENGLWMAVGEPEYAGTDPITGVAQGRVSIYRWTGAAWEAAGTLLDPSVANDERFGFSVDLSADGDQLVVGAPGVNSSAGAAYSFLRSKATGTNTNLYEQLDLVQTHVATDANAGDMFGYSVAINRAGTQFVVGAPGDDAAGTEAGGVYLFNWGTAGQQDKRLPVVDSGEVANQQNYDRFGWSVAFDGNVVVVGAPFDSFGTGMQFNGSATVLSVGASAFSGAFVKGSGADDYDMYGWSVSLDAYEASNASLIVAVGSPGDDTKDFDAGAVYIYRWAGLSATPSQAELNTILVSSKVVASSTVLPYDPRGYDGFGVAVAVDVGNANLTDFNNDVKTNGVRLAVGSRVNGGYNGNAYLFRAKSDWTWLGQSYSQTGVLSSTTSTGNKFGWAVAVSNSPSTSYSVWNGTYTVTPNAARIVVGAPETDILTNATYTQSGTTVTVTKASHGLAVGQTVYLDFGGGAAMNYDFPGVVASSAAGSFTVISPHDLTQGTGVAVTYNTTGSNGSVHWASSDGTKIETTSGMLSASLDKWLDSAGTGLPASSWELTPRSRALVADSGVSVRKNVVVPLADTSAADVAATPVDDPLLFLLQTSTSDASALPPAPAVDEEMAPAGNAQASTVLTLSRQLQALSDRHHRASADLLGRLSTLVV